MSNCSYIKHFLESFVPHVVDLQLPKPSLFYEDNDGFKEHAAYRQFLYESMKMLISSEINIENAIFPFKHFFHKRPNEFIKNI